MTVLLLLVLAPATAVFLLSKCFFLARWRVGVVMMLANVVYETLYKRFGWSRGGIDLILLPVLTVGWGLWLGWGWATAVALTGTVAWVSTLLLDLQWRGGALARQDRRHQAGLLPLPIPRFVVVLRGPVLARGAVNELGEWPEGWEAGFELLVLNPSLVPPQFPLRVELAVTGEGLEVPEGGSREVAAPDPEQVTVIRWTVRARSAGAGGEVRVRVDHADFHYEKVLRVRRVVSRTAVRCTRASITRWKYGAAAGFGWRGDHDLYDPATFQSVAGLRRALGLSRRLRVPSTLFISGRLSLVEEEHREYCARFGWDRRSGEIPDFIRFMREEVDMRGENEFPLEATKPYAAEVGNHMYLHWGTEASPAPGNNWKMHAWIGEGRHEWQQPGPSDSFSEQRDNAIKNSEVIREILGVNVTSWGVPGRVYDGFTARAVEAAGIEIGTDTDASGFTNVLRLPPPHHPAGCDRLVEITKKYPGDPNDAYKVAMLKYWLHAARRTGRVFLFMAHHHLLRYQSNACYHITEEFFRYVLAECEGEFYVATVTALGRYWRDVLSPRTRCVEVLVEGDQVRVRNNGARDLTGLPLEVELAGGHRFLCLLDVPAQGERSVVLAAGGSRTPVAPA